MHRNFWPSCWVRQFRPGDKCLCTGQGLCWQEDTALPVIPARVTLWWQSSKHRFVELQVKRCPYFPLKPGWKWLIVCRGSASHWNFMIWMLLKQWLCVALNTFQQHFGTDLKMWKSLPFKKYLFQKKNSTNTLKLIYSLCVNEKLITHKSTNMFCFKSLCAAAVCNFKEAIRLTFAIV